MKVRPTYGGIGRVHQGLLEDAIPSNCERLAVEDGVQPLLWIESPCHPVDASSVDWLVGPASLVLESRVGFDEPESAFVMLQLDPFSRQAAKELAAWLLGLETPGCRLMWDGRWAALIGSPATVERMDAELRSRVTRPGSYVDRGPRRGPPGASGPEPHRLRRLGARDRRPVEFRAHTLPAAEKSLKATRFRLEQWGAEATAQAVDRCVSQLKGGLDGLGGPDGVSVFEHRVQRIVDLLTRPTSAGGGEVPSLIEAAADSYLHALTERQGLGCRSSIFFGESFEVVVAVEGELLVGIPARLASRVGSWPLIAMPLVEHELDPFGREAPSAAEIVSGALGLAGDTFRYAVERWGVWDIDREREMREALREVEAPDSPSLDGRLRMIEDLLQAAESGAAYVNETEIVLRLAAAEVNRRALND